MTPASPERGGWRAEARASFSRLARGRERARRVAGRNGQVRVREMAPANSPPRASASVRRAHTSTFRQLAGQFTIAVWSEFCRPWRGYWRVRIFPPRLTPWASLFRDSVAHDLHDHCLNSDSRPLVPAAQFPLPARSLSRKLGHHEKASRTSPGEFHSAREPWSLTHPCVPVGAASLSPGGTAG